MQNFFSSRKVQCARAGTSKSTPSLNARLFATPPSPPHAPCCFHNLLRTAKCHLQPRLSLYRISPINRPTRAQWRAIIINYHYHRAPPLRSEQKRPPTPATCCPSAAHTTPHSPSRPVYRYRHLPTRLPALHCSSSSSGCVQRAPLPVLVGGRGAHRRASVGCSSGAGGGGRACGARAEQAVAVDRQTSTTQIVDFKTIVYNKVGSVARIRSPI